MLQKQYVAKTIFCNISTLPATTTLNRMKSSEEKKIAAAKITKIISNGDPHWTEWNPAETNNNVFTVPGIPPNHIQHNEIQQRQKINCSTGETPTTTVNKMESNEDKPINCSTQDLYGEIVCIINIRQDFVQTTMPGPTATQAFWSLCRVLHSV